jgi:hypothetical protein
VELYKLKGPLTTNHKRKVLSSLNKYIQARDVDQEIIPYLNKINSIPNCVTMHSCIGHHTHKNDTGYIVIWFDHGVYDSLVRFMYNSKYITIPYHAYEKLEDDEDPTVDKIELAVCLFNECCAGFYSVKGSLLDYIDHITEEIKEF